jgi:predicted glycosyltransferase
MVPSTGSSGDLRFVEIGLEILAAAGSGNPPIAKASPASSTRRTRLLAEVDAIRPRVLLVDGLPFGSKSDADDIMSLIAKIRDQHVGEGMVAAISDSVMSDQFYCTEKEVDWCARILNRCFDAVIVRSDPMFARFEEFFQPNIVVEIPVYHVGFVPPSEATTDRLFSDRRGIAVLAGYGQHGPRLLQSSIEAQKILRRTTGEPMTIVVPGELFPAMKDELEKQAEGVAGLTLKYDVADEEFEMASARWCVCCCNERTATHVMRSDTPVIIVPDAPRNQQENTERARRLVHWGAGRMLMPWHVNGASLANEIQQLMKFERRKARFNLQGANNVARLISQALYPQDPLHPELGAGRRLH